MTPQLAVVMALNDMGDGADPMSLSDAQTFLAALPDGWALVDRRRLRFALEELTLQQGAQQERERWAEAARRNHGDRGHPEPFTVCPREVCVWAQRMVLANEEATK